MIWIAGVVILGCSDSPPTQPEDPNSLESQIRTLFQPNTANRDQALTQLGGIRQQVALGATANAQSQALGLVSLTLTSLREGKLTGGTSTATANSASRIIDALYQLVGLDPPRLPDGALSNDGAAQVVGPAGGQVITPSGAAGVDVPPGALGQSVLITVSRLPASPTPGAGPLPTSLKQYPPFYDFAAHPNVQFGDSLRVGICQVTDPGSPFYPPEPHERLRLAHSVGTSVEILERVGVNDFLRCTGVSPFMLAPASLRRGWEIRLGSIVAPFIAALQPRELLAAHGGLGGKVRSFSPFGAVDVGSPTGQVVAVGQFHTCALNQTGAAFCWGDNRLGQLGNGGTSGSVTPVPVTGGLQFRTISANNYSTCALTDDGVAYCWGRRIDGVLSTAPVETQPFSNVPIPVPGGIRFSTIGVGIAHACGLTTTGAAYCWGNNRDLQLGTGDTASVATPTAVSGALTFNSLSVGGLHTCGLTSAGTGYCWGNNLWRAIDGASQANRIGTPVPAAPGLVLSSINAGATTTCALSNSLAYCWGFGGSGNRGDGTVSSNTSSRTGVAGGLSFTSLAAGNGNQVDAPNCGLSSQGIAFCWGSNRAGELGTTAAMAQCTLGQNLFFPCTGTPVRVSGNTTFITIVPGAAHTCALSASRKLFCWGANNFGQVGDGTTVQRNVPVEVAGGIRFP